MLTLPKKDFRGLPLTFVEFCDLAIIGMAGLASGRKTTSTPLCSAAVVNYRAVILQLGLAYEPRWIERFSMILEDPINSIAEHVKAPDGAPDDGHWVKLNAEFFRIANDLFVRYYGSNVSSD